MVKTSQEQIKRDEKKVIKELEKNSNESIEEIAKHCGFSRQKVWRIIKRLEKDKTIWGYHAVTDDETLGLTTFFVLMKRTNKPLTKDIVNIIVSLEMKKKLEHLNIQSVGSYFVHGSYDWILIIKSHGITQVKMYIDAILQTFGEYICEAKVEEVMFSLQKGNIDNPHPEKIRDYFLA